MVFPAPGGAPMTRLGETASAPAMSASSESMGRLVRDKRALGEELRALAALEVKVESARGWVAAQETSDARSRLRQVVDGGMDDLVVDKCQRESRGIDPIAKLDAKLRADRVARLGRSVRLGGRSEFLEFERCKRMIRRLFMISEPALDSRRSSMGSPAKKVGFRS
jgi:hypothetical protein